MNLYTVLTITQYTLIAITFQCFFTAFVPNPNIRCHLATAPKVGFGTAVHTRLMERFAFFTATYATCAPELYKRLAANNTISRLFMRFIPARFYVAGMGAIDCLPKPMASNIELTCADWAYKCSPVTRLAFRSRHANIPGGLRVCVATGFRAIQLAFMPNVFRTALLTGTYNFSHTPIISHYAEYLAIADARIAAMGCMPWLDGEV